MSPRESEQQSLLFWSTQVRRFDFVPLWGIAVCLVYQMRRMTARGGAIEGEATETDRFENVVLKKSTRPVDYFDVRLNEPFPWASPLQTWLELMRGDKRDRETAEQIREMLLKLDDRE